MYTSYNFNLPRKKKSVLKTGAIKGKVTLHGKGK